MKSLAHCITLVALLVSLSAAQKHPSAGKAAPLADRLVAVKTMGTARYSDKEVLAASGLQIGQPAADGDFKEAVRRLGESGLFREVAYSYSSSGASVKLELQLADTDQSKLVPARFENFAGFTDGELLAAVQLRVPLFKQVLPLTGDLPDRVAEALQAILTDKRFPGRVDFLREGDQSGGPLSAVVYRIEETSIHIRDIEFPGASPEQTALLEAAARRLKGAEYGRSVLAAAAKFDFLPVYLQRGYLKAAFGQSDARVVAPSAVADAQERADLQSDVQVDAILPVVPGKMYETLSVDWKGNSALPTAEVASLIHLPPGQPADGVRLVRDLESVSKLYRSRGYMTVQIKSDAQFDDDKSTVHYDLNVKEGDLYKMGELEILGLDTQATARMRAAWTLREGQPYDADYPRKFHQETGPLLPRGLQWDISTHEALDSKDKTVDVEIRYKQQ
jgi:outer membrane protein assembly factor BamA